LNLGEVGEEESVPPKHFTGFGVVGTSIWFTPDYIGIYYVWDQWWWLRIDQDWSSC
jgi:hypothetical protein